MNVIFSLTTLGCLLSATLARMAGSRLFLLILMHRASINMVMASKIRHTPATPSVLPTVSIPSGGPAPKGP